MAEINEPQPMSLKEFQSMPKQEGWRYELLDGIMLMTPPSANYHQEIINNISEKLLAILDLKQCRPLSETACMVNESYFVPDLSVYYSNSNIPIIVFEVLSPSTHVADLLYKPRLYKKINIREYWLVDPMGGTITVYDFANDTTEIYTDSQDIIKSHAIPEISFSISEIMQEIFF